jgi:hypothetical protein
MLARHPDLPANGWHGVVFRTARLPGCLHALLDEFSSRDDPDGEPLSLLWIMHAASGP